VRSCAIPSFVPFIPGRRPEDEAVSPGLGSSEDVGVILPGGEEDSASLLYTADGDVRVTVSFTGPDGSSPPVPVPGWEDRPLAPERFAPESDRLVLRLSPTRDLLQGEDRFTFEHQFSQRMRIELREGDEVATTSLFVVDLRRCGSLYARLLDRLVVPDTARQGGDDPAYHPWFPVLLIGSDKAALYTRALVQDITEAGQHLSDPGWLLRVGLYLELLTFLGICEAVGQEDLLSPAERHAFETAPAFAELRERIDPQAWREVWELRSIAFPRRGAPRTGPVSGLNLLAKKKATLRFLHVHHEDLKHAIELAGANRHNAQETWQRVFRDAERAVLRNIPEAFPELGFMPEQLRDLILWHRGVRVPPALGGVLADQQGLFASACNQYRASMNHVARWARRRGLMDHTGRECVPRQVSLLEAHVNQPSRVALLQRYDGYGPALDVGASLPEAYRRPAAELAGLLAGAPLFAELSAIEREALARAARPMTLGPTERLVIQGRESTRSLYVLADGELEVLRRDEHGHDYVIDRMEKGAVVGEMSLLTGEPYSATVRALDGAVVYEFGAPQHDPILRDHPGVVSSLRTIMDERTSDRSEREAAAEKHDRRSRLRSLLFTR
jgi:CRP-like cAMP-binding protein